MNFNSVTNALEAYIELELGEETVEYVIFFTYDFYIGRAAKLGGLPENRYPADPEEFEFTNIKMEVANGMLIEVPYEYEHLFQGVMEDAMRNDIQEKAERYEEDKAEYRYELRRGER